MNEIVKINPEEYGLEKNEAEQVKVVFLPMIAKMEEMENEYNEVIKLEPTQENCKKAKELRLRFVKVRTGTADIHKTAKAYYLNWWRFVDGFKNTVTFAIQGKEDELEKLENHFENLEKERLAKLQEERIKLISQYVLDYEHLQLWTMADDVWNAYFEAKKKEFNDKVEAEKKVEEERVKKIEEEKRDQERIRAENEKLKQEAEAREKQLTEERAEAKKKQDELEAKAKQEAEAREKLEKEKREQEEKIKKEQEDNKRLSQEELYKSFLKENEWKYDKIIKEEWKVVLYKAVSEFLI